MSRKKNTVMKKRLSIRLDSRDYYDFKYQAKRQGLTMAKYQRLLIRHPNQSANATMSFAKSNNNLATSLDKIANGQLAYIGSNLNQIARAVNSGKVTSIDTKKLLDVQNDVNKAMNEITLLKSKVDEKL